MSNESSPVGGTHGFDSDALEEWVAETASQKGVSKQKLLDEILSSYWVLEELSGVVTDSEVANDPRQSEDQPPVDTSSDHTSGAAGDGEVDSSHTGLSSTAEFSELKSELQGLRTAIEELSQDQGAEDETETESTDEGLSLLEGQLDDLSSAVVERQTETDETVAELSERIETLNERLTAIESQLDEGMSLSELESAVEENSTEQTELQQRLESEFDSIEQVLQHLLDTTDNIEYRLGAVSDSRREALRPIQKRQAMQDELIELKQEALRHEIDSGACDNCDQNINLGLLETPECPSCERRFTGIKKGGWFSKTELQTTKRPRSQDQQWSTNSENATADGRDANSSDSYQTDW